MRQARETKGGGGADRKRKRVMEKVEREKRRVGGARKGGGELVKTKNELPVMSMTPRPSPQSTTYGDKTTCDTSGAGRNIRILIDQVDICIGRGSRGPRKI